MSPFLIAALIWIGLACVFALGFAIGASLIKNKIRALMVEGSAEAEKELEDLLDIELTDDPIPERRNGTQQARPE